MWMDRIKIPEDQKYFSTKEVVELIGVTKDALRYYEHIGIMGSIKRDAHNYRQYTKKDLDRLVVIKVMRMLGMDISTLAGRNDLDDPQQMHDDLVDYQKTVQEQLDNLNEINSFLKWKINFLENK